MTGQATQTVCGENQPKWIRGLHRFSQIEELSIFGLVGFIESMQSADKKRQDFCLENKPFEHGILIKYRQKLFFSTKACGETVEKSLEHLVNSV
ncbi:hypothetical protein [Desulforhabdus amnigena]|jgi:hypothetical protein|uniref:Uncharacterized protein n=1 Tax=Desulforhabdus amnigena TaxID=40218 RepID=A0A9W6FVL9_9BACT|nr:hypothetical protein [Desulforhabdus amnigena]NLJ28196.1 hypothetical protein [Deltaproteobacteria bacterium]GLI35719.1 hypothetical protein DAMNIGENAA_31520 [Desulforhabdus amnigena]